MLTADDLAAIVADAGAGRRRGVGRLRRRTWPPSPTRPPELRARRRDRRPGGRRAASPSTRWATSTTDAEAPVAATGRRLAGVLALQLRARPAAEGRHAPPRQPRRRRPRPTPASVLEHRPRRPLPLGRQAVLRLRARQLADVPARRRGDRRPQPAPARRRPDVARARRAPSSRRCSSPARASSPPCSTPTPPATPFASVRATVTAGEALPADLHRRFTERFGHPVLDGIGTTEALHIFLSNTHGRRAPGHERHAGAGLRGPAASTTTGGEVAAPDTPGLPPRARAVDRHRLLVPRRDATAGGVPGRVAAHRRRVHAARPTATGRSSAATTT